MIKFGVGVGEFVRQFLPQSDQPENLFTLSGDNTATIITITTGITTWRSRHYAYRAGWARDQVHDGPIKVVYTPGQGLSADPLTKVLQGGAAVTTRQTLTLTDGNKDTAVILAQAIYTPNENVEDIIEFWLDMYPFVKYEARMDPACWCQGGNRISFNNLWHPTAASWCINGTVS